MRRQPLPAASRATIGAVLVGFGTQALLVVSGVLVARTLGPENRGYLALLALFPAILSELGNLGLPLAVTYYIARDRTHAAAIARSGVRPFLLQLAVLTAVHAVIVAILVGGEPRYVCTAGLFTLMAVPASLAQRYGLAIMQGQRRFTAFNILRLLPAAAYVGAISAIFVVGSGELPLVALAWATSNLMVGAATLGLAGWGVLAPAFRGPGDVQAPSLGNMLRFGLRGLLGSVSPVQTLRADQAVVGLFLSPVALGLYVVALAFTNLPRFVAQSVGMVAYPSVAAHTDEAAARRSMWAFFWATVAMSVAIVAPLLLAAGRLVPLFFGDEFRGAARVTQILLPGTLVAGARGVLGETMKGRGHPTAGTLAEVAAWLWLAPALGVAVPLWGVNGVALSVSTSYVVSFGVLLALAAACGEVPLPSRVALSPRAAWHRLRLFATPRLP